MEAIEVLTSDRVAWLNGEFTKTGWARAEGYFRNCFAAQERGEMVFLVARDGEELLGFLRVVWDTDYPPFRESRIPEIQDLIVVPAHRRQGVASRLLDEAERTIATRSLLAGIGVGLHPGYAAAQRLYALRGYVPDGNPLTYRGEFVCERQQVMLDDDLTMYLVKQL